MRAAAVVFVVAVALSGRALAFEEFHGSRVEGMGVSGRAWSLGGSALLLNPSGMSLLKAYNVEASYAYTSRFSGHYLHASVVDSTSALNVAGGLYYTYRTDKPLGLAGHGHEAGGALSLPIGDHVAVGATAKWFRLAGADVGPTNSSGGVTFDAGVTVRPIASLSLAVVGANLRDLNTAKAARKLGYGIAFLPLPNLVLALDGVTVFTYNTDIGARGTGVAAGGELSIAERLGIRAGGGTDPLLGTGYVSGGLSAVSEVGAIDFGIRGDLFRIKEGSSKELFLGVSLRLFVSEAIASSSAASQ